MKQLLTDLKTVNWSSKISNLTI